MRFRSAWWYLGVIRSKHLLRPDTGTAPQSSSRNLSDGGFTGPHESVIGREIEPIVRRFLTGMPQRFEVARGRVLLQGALLELDNSSGRAWQIERISREWQPSTG